MLDNEDDDLQGGGQGGKEKPDEGGDKGKGGGKEDTVTLSKAEVESLRRERDEARQSERYWAGLARQTGSGGGQQRDHAGEPDDDDDAREFLDDDDGADGLPDDTPEKLVDEFAAQGVKALQKRGFITEKDAIKIATEAALKVSRTLISRERGKITSDTQLMTEFPELKDQNSELFKATAKNYQEAVKLDPRAAKTPAALYLAARAARAELKASGDGDGRRRRGGDGGDFEPESEADRRRRASSQDSRSRGRSNYDDDDDMLGDEARSVLRQMGLTEQEFTDSRKQYGSGRQTRTARR